MIQFLVVCFLVGTAIHLYKSRANRDTDGTQLHNATVAASFLNEASQIDSEYTALQEKKNIVTNATSTQRKINLNSATKQELMTLPKIGTMTADRILEYRAQIGKFTKIEELKNVNGIGEKTFERIKGEITLE